MKISACYATAWLWLLFAAVSGAQAAAEPAAPRIAQELLQPHLVRLGDGRRLNFTCVGSGSPTVVFEQGGEGMIFNWAKVQPAVSAMSRTCFYDRGGFGWSDPPRYPVTARSVTDDLHALLRQARVKGPIVLVGHSIGGFYATMYADRFPSEVAGLVLVDPGFSGQSSGAVAERANVDQANIRRGEGYLLQCAELAKTGRLTTANLAENRCFPLPPDAVGAEEQRYALHAITNAAWYEAEHSQSVNYFSADQDLSVSQRQARDAARPFGALPLIVLSRARVQNEPWRTRDENQAYLERWRAGHAALAARSSRGRLLVVPNSGHFIQKDQPQAVIEAVREVLTAARAGPD